VSLSNQTPLEATLEKVFATIPDGNFVCYIDLASGLVLAMHARQPIPQDITDLLGALMNDMFQGQHVTMMEKLTHKYQNLGDKEHYFQTILSISRKQLNVFMRSERFPQYVAVFNCRASVNLGMLLSKARAALPLIEDAA
jgi:hypothetical protein